MDVGFRLTVLYLNGPYRIYSLALYLVFTSLPPPSHVPCDHTLSFSSIPSSFPSSLSRRFFPFFFIFYTLLAHPLVVVVVVVAIFEFGSLPTYISQNGDNTVPYLCRGSPSTQILKGTDRKRKTKTAAATAAAWHVLFFSFRRGSLLEPFASHFLHLANPAFSLGRIWPKHKMTTLCAQERRAGMSQRRVLLN
ncbi:hypothetical protein F4778DRAFT_670144 [Xylariomycetidae sp. FL2044]|nr:hypothetical protein F4778DRAFT_670144 [Xylariomycetidae sp. FL2044]